ncbi:MAG TPA: Sua5/YciO/YrdC/YwlC family protein [Nevskiaceae bacterium]|nr:Sua5/YciO/YrdC/YwlC family protein [Nevskiaceae bacterium]
MIALRRAVRALREGGVIAYPTEAVWGLGCEPLNRHAVERLLAIKQRDWRKGVILIADTFEQLWPFIADPNTSKLEPALASWPGPATWLMPASAIAPRWITGGRDRIAVRVTAHPIASALCRAHGGPIVSTSANRSKRPALRSRLQVERQFRGVVDDIVAGEVGGLARPTAIRDLETGEVVRA